MSLWELEIGFAIIKVSMPIFSPSLYFTFFVCPKTPKYLDRHVNI